MTLKSLTIIALFAAGLGATATSALAQGVAAVPANFPPSSFQGRQFVDNNGCVFVRAGFDGATTWVPRVSRQRKQLCGQKPTFGGTVAAQAPARAAPQRGPVQITADPPKPAVTASRSTGSIRISKPLQGTTLTTAPAPRAMQPAPRTTARQPAMAPKPQPLVRRVVRAPASKPVAAQPPRVIRRAPAAQAPAAPRGTYRVVPGQTAGACTGTRTYQGRTVKTRCGPQTTPHVTVIRRGEAPAPGKNVYYNNGWQGSSLSLPGETRIVPRHVYETQQETQDTVVPVGYRPAWEDDRLNPYRAHQTVAGHHATQQVWSNTVPRQLVSQVRRHEVKQPVIAYRARSDAYAQPMIATQGRMPIVSTRGALNASSRYVEIGAFTSQAKADAAAARLSGAGLPVRFGNVSKGGQMLRRVMVGPYTSTAALGDALNSAKAVGYTRAYLR